MDIIARESKCSSDTKSFTRKNSISLSNFWESNRDSIEESFQEVFMCLKVRTYCSCCPWTNIFDSFKGLNTEIKMKNIFHVVKQRGKEFRSTFPNSWNSKCANKSINWKCTFRFNGTHEIIDRFFLVSLDEEEFISVIPEIINRCHIGHPP